MDLSATIYMRDFREVFVLLAPTRTILIDK